MTSTAIPTAEVAAVEPTATAPATQSPQVAPAKETAKDAAPQQTEAQKKEVAKPDSPKARSLLSEPEKQAEPKDAKGAEGEAKDAESNKPKVPEKYEPWKLPDGSSLSEELDASFSALARKAGLSQSEAQAALESMTGALEKQNQAKLTEWINKAADETAALPEYSGKAMEESRARVARAFKAYGSEELQGLLETPLGMLTTNQKAWWRFLDKVGADVSDDALVSGRNSAPRAATPDDFYESITAPGDRRK